MAMHMRLWCPSPSPFVASNLQKKKQKKKLLKDKRVSPIQFIKPSEDGAD